MASDSETLNIGSLRGKNHPPKPGAPVQPAAQTQPRHPRPIDPVNHPAAAAAARARLDAIQFSPIVDPGAVPSAPTADLITDKQELAHRVAQNPEFNRRRKLPSALIPMLTAVGIFLLVLLMFKAPIILSQLNYSLGSKQAPATTATTANAPTDANIIIPKINVSAPVVYEPSIQEADVQKALQSGVVHYGNTAFPGQNGNVAIFGHSSNDWWEPGNFKFVFVLLDKLAPGDKLTIDYKGVPYQYEVTGSKIVEPTEVSVLNPTQTPTLTIITCSPPGTSLRRLVVTAKQISPDPTKATVSPTQDTTTTPQALSSSAPDFFTQVSQAFNGIYHGILSLFGGDTSTPQASPSASPSSDGSSGGSIPAIK